jgi:hypothetical protein
MKKIFVITMLSAACFSALADTSGAGAGAGQNTNVTSTATGTATNAGNSQAITFTSPDQTTTIVGGGTDSALKETITGTQVVKNTPSVSGPPLVSSNDTCMGSASASGNLPGIGLSFGKTYTDSNCVMLKNSRELWNMGMKAAALALMCTDSANKDALELTGFVCPQTKRDQANKAQAAIANEPTDPIVRKRMGLPELASAK